MPSLASRILGMQGSDLDSVIEELHATLLDGIRLIDMNTGDVDSRYARVGDTNTFTGDQTINGRLIVQNNSRLATTIDPVGQFISDGAAGCLYLKREAEQQSDAIMVIEDLGTNNRNGINFTYNGSLNALNIVAPNGNAINATGGITATGPLGIGSIVSTGSLTVSGSASVGPLTVAGAETILGDLVVTGAVSSGSHVVLGSISATTTISAGGLLTGSQLAISGTASTGALTVSGGATVSGNLGVFGGMGVTGGLTINGNAVVTDTLTVSGSIVGNVTGNASTADFATNAGSAGIVKTITYVESLVPFVIKTETVFGP